MLCSMTLKRSDCHREGETHGENATPPTFRGRVRTMALDPPTLALEGND